MHMQLLQKHVQHGNCCDCACMAVDLDVASIMPLYRPRQSIKTI
jgi:hypothetical protein